jgi:hypothetical protein
MGPIGMPEMIVVFLFFGVIALIVVVVVASKSRKGPSAGFSRSNSAQERLSEIDALRKKNLITEVEYEAKRKGIVDSL